MLPERDRPEIEITDDAVSKARDWIVNAYGGTDVLATDLTVADVRDILCAALGLDRGS